MVSINAQMDVLNAVWGAQAGPPFCVLHDDLESAWLNLYRPIVTAYVQGATMYGEAPTGGTVMMPVLINGEDHSGHVVLLVFDHSTRVQHVFDSNYNHNEFTASEGTGPISFSRRVFRILTTNVLVDGYTPATLPSNVVVSTQQNFEGHPEAIDYNTDGGTCSVMVLLVACVCRRFGLTDPVAAGDLLRRAVWQRVPPEHRTSLRRRLWAWQSHLTITATTCQPTTDALQQILGLRGRGVGSCGVRLTDGTPCPAESAGDVVYCPAHASRLLARAEDPVTVTRLASLCRPTTPTQWWTPIPAIVSRLVPAQAATVTAYLHASRGDPPVIHRDPRGGMGHGTWMVLQTVGPVSLAWDLPFGGLAGLVIVVSASATTTASDSGITDADLHHLPPTTAVVRDDGAVLVLRGAHHPVADVLVWLEEHRSSLQNVDVTLPDTASGLAGRVLQLLLRCGWHTVGARLRARIGDGDGDRPVHRVRVKQKYGLDHEVEVTYGVGVQSTASNGVEYVLAQHQADMAVTIGYDATV